MASRTAGVPRFMARLAASPCCAAITTGQAVEAALASRVGIIFVLRADGLSLGPLVERIHRAGKLVAVHLDLVDGLRADRSAVRWLSRSGVDAVISAHGQLMRAVQRDGMVAVHRLLLVRGGLLESGFAAVARSGADIVEVLPGAILPDVRALLPTLRVPLLAGGFIRTEEEARAVLAAGAVGVTTSSRDLWNLDFG